ncbi:MAG TPA: ABC transporter permease [Dehalococcoidia bacterium]|jgi:oligopeptide transport system permease protein
MASERIGVLEGSEAPITLKARGLWGDAFHRLIRNRLALVGLAVVSSMILVAILAPLIAPQDPNAQDLTATFLKPSSEHLMGTDNLGRDWFSRLVYGARLSMTVGFFAQAVILSIGVTIGITAGFFGGRMDNLLMRFTDLVYAFPDLLFIILLRGVFGGNIFTLFFIIGLVHWVDIARLVRGQILSLKEREFVEAAKALGATNTTIMWRHLFPNTLGPIIVVVTFGVPRAIFTEAALSFIGFGVDPRTPSWGSMIFEGYSGIFAFPNLVIFPAIAIALVMLSFTFLGDGLRDALDPRTRGTT